MNERPTTKRRRKKTAAARLRPFWLLVVLALAGATAIGYFLVTWPALRPHAIVVEGNRMVARDDVLKAAAVNPATNLWLQNTHAMAERIDAIPYVLDAQVHREPPATVKIVITERQPFALLQAANGRVLVDRRLRVLQPADQAGAQLPVIVAPEVEATTGALLTQPELTQLRDDEVALQKAGLASQTLEHDKYGDLVVTLRDGVRVLFGDESDLEKKIPLVDPILVQVGRQRRPIAAIDLRAPSTPVVVYKK